MSLISDNKKRLAIIPARGGSKRILKKNIKFFHGEPIILKVLKEVEKSNLFDEIHVSTDSVEIAKIVEEAGFNIKFLRDKYLSNDDSPVGEVVKDVVKKYSNLGHSYETIALIYSTAVLIDNEILKSAVKEFEDGDNSVQLLSVSKFPAPIERAMRMDHNILSAVNEEEIVKPSNHLSDAWFETGDFVIYNEKEALTNNKSSKKRGFCIPRWLSIDIDNLDDWETAEWIYKKTYM